MLASRRPDLPLLSGIIEKRQMGVKKLIRREIIDKIDFSKKEIAHIPLDERKDQDAKDITPGD